MKDSLTIYKFASTIAAIAFFVPIIILAAKRMLRDNLVTWFAAFWGWAGLINVLFAGNFISNDIFLRSVERVYNLADAPFMLFILYKTTYIEKIRKSIERILLPFLLFELLFTLITKLDGPTESIMVAAGVVIILFYVSRIIAFHLHGVRGNSFHYGMQFIYYAILFEYGVSIITFLYSYIMPDSATAQDSFFIFHLGTIITIITASYGMLVYKEIKPERKKKRLVREREAEITFL